MKKAKPSKANQQAINEVYATLRKQHEKGILTMAILIIQSITMVTITQQGNL